jgi:basic amino acid/polyamine antiporter, APA family
MTLVRSIGRWTMTALVINCIIGSGIFGLPGELNRLLGRASPFAMIFAALAMALIMACSTEVASQFGEAGGPYLYVRTAFGRFMGIQIGWFHLLSCIGAVAAAANLFVDYLGTMVPWRLTVSERDLIMAVLVGVPTAANYRGVRTGANLSSIMTLAKVSPMAMLIIVGLIRFAQQPPLVQLSQMPSPGWSNWLRSMALLVFTFGGWEDSLIPSGEIREPRQTIPFALGIGLLCCALIYMLLQFVTVATVGPTVTQQPLQRTASILLGRGGALLVVVMIMMSSYGWIAADLLNGPRLAYSLALKGDFPSLLGRIHTRYHTPATAILVYAFVAWVLAVSGSFLFVLALAAGAMMVYFAGMCAALMPLRRMRPNADAWRIPFGPALSGVAVAIALGFMSGLKPRELLLMFVTALIAAANWLWVRRRHIPSEAEMRASA